MKSRPILYSTPMVRAVLAERKTHTRRIANTEIVLGREALICSRGKARYAPTFLLPDAAELAVAHCPYGQPGDRLWVRETWAEGIHQMADIDHWAYAADHFGVQQRLGDRWKPSIHMPRAASRITLEITAVRLERLQSISEADAIAEGIEFFNDDHECGCRNYMDATGKDWTLTPLESFKSLWQSINGPGSWDLNPWVWVIEFRRLP